MPLLTMAICAVGTVIGIAGLVQAVSSILYSDLCPDEKAYQLGFMVGNMIAGAIGGGLGNKFGPKNPGCFVAGTLVTMADGSQKKIEEVKEGDLVLARDEASGKTEARKVEHKSAIHVDATRLLTFSDGSKIETTDEHPFYVEGRGFLPAKEAGVGTSIVTRAGPALQITDVQVKHESTTVYNFTVEGVHTYFVGDAQAWVHNNDCGSPNPPREPEGPYRPVNPTKQQVDWETDLPSTAYPGRSRAHHFKEANKNLLDAADNDPAFHGYLDDNYPGWRNSIEGPRGGIKDRSPAGLTWHHGDTPGKMQLVPRDLHQHFHGLYHPNGFGGFDIWG